MSIQSPPGQPWPNFFHFNHLKVSETHPKLIFVQKFDWKIVCPFAISSCCNSNIMIYCKKVWQSISIEKAIAIDWIKILQSKIIVILACMNCYIRAFACSRQWDYFLNKIFQYIYMNAISGPATLNKQSLITCRSTFVLTNDDKLLFPPRWSENNASEKARRSITHQT